MKSRISWFSHLRSIYYLRLNRMSTHKMQCEFAQYLEKGANSKRIKYFGRSENLIAESLGEAQSFLVNPYVWMKPYRYARCDKCGE